MSRCNEKTRKAVNNFDKTEVVSEYSVEALDCCKIKLVYSPQEFLKDSIKRSFKPALVHQVFGQSERIFGYKHPEVTLLVTAGSMQFLTEVKYRSVIDPSRGLQPDNINHKLLPWLPQKYYTNREQFSRVVERDDASKMFGEVIDKFTVYNGIENETNTFTINLCSPSEPGFEDFHSRFELLIVWFIDAASLIEINDPSWIFLYLYEERTLPNGKTGYYVAGFCTIYKFYHYPDKVRARISQLFIIPPCQRKGLGTKLLNAAYKIICDMPNVIDITVEDPCIEFTRMRDLVDCQLLMQLNCFKYPLIRNGFSQEMYEEANTQFKINKKQSRHVYEILRMMHSLKHSSTKDLKNLHLEIRQRFEAPYRRDQRNRRKKGIPSPTKDDLVIYISRRDGYLPSMPTGDYSEEIKVYMETIKEFAMTLMKKAHC